MDNLSKKMRATDASLKKRLPSEIMTTKLKDENIRKRIIKYDTMCPLFGIFQPCTNLIFKDYCPYQHCEDVRKAYKMQISQIEDGLAPDLEAMDNCAIQNATNLDEATYRKSLLRKYPAWPED